MTTPLTYSFQESTFARRLLRAAYERCYRVLSDPVRNKSIIDEMCKFTFCFNNYPNVKRWITKMTQTGSKDSLELWQAPQLHIGNAGLHYPRTSLDAMSGEPPLNWTEKAPMGPPASVIPETPMPPEMSIRDIIKYVGFEGEWFDPNDVEHYLRNKGLFIDEQSSLVELDINEVPSLDATTAADSGSASSGLDSDPTSPDSVEARIPALQASNNVAAFPNIANVDADLGMDYGMDYGSYLNRPNMNADSFFNESYFTWETASRKMFDVDKFIRSKPFQARHFF